jgi:hypothetical protein
MWVFIFLMAQLVALQTKQFPLQLQVAQDLLPEAPIMALNWPEAFYERAQQRAAAPLLYREPVAVSMPQAPVALISELFYPAVLC